jgi:hypothetical protein
VSIELKGSSAMPLQIAGQGYVNDAARPFHVYLASDIIALSSATRRGVGHFELVFSPIFPDALDRAQMFLTSTGIAGTGVFNAETYLRSKKNSSRFY